MRAPRILPSLLDDETLYSVAARYHLLSSNTTSVESCENLFENRQGGLHHDFPSGVAAFASRTGYCGGDPIEILRRLTVFPFFSMFLSRETAARAQRAMLSPSAPHIKFEIGTMSSRVDNAHPLKACPDCIRSDILTSGFSYWHRSHQLPGVLVCDIHGCPLVELLLKTNRLSKQQYLLPSDIRQLSVTFGAACMNAAGNVLTQLALDAQFLLRNAASSLDMRILQHTYHQGLKRQELVTVHGMVRQKSFMDAFMSHYATLSKLSYFSPLLHEDTVSLCNASLVRKPRSAKHPLKHLLLISFLFDGVDDFFKCYANSIAHQSETIPERRPEPAYYSSRLNHNELTKLLVEQGLSLSAASIYLGVSISTLTVHAERAGIDVQRRARKINEKLHRQIADALTIGVSFKDIQTRFQISRASVQRILEANPAIHARRNEVMTLTKCDAKRTEFTEFIQKHPDCTRKEIAKASGSGYKWLYRNDGDWLEEHLPARICGKMSRKSVDWTSRDHHFSQQVRSVALSLYADLGKPTRVSRTALYRHIPELGRKASCIDQMPETAKALEISAESTTAYRARLLRWARTELEKTEGAVPSYRVARLAGVPNQTGA